MELAHTFAVGRFYVPMKTASIFVKLMDIYFSAGSVFLFVYRVKVNVFMLFNNKNFKGSLPSLHLSLKWVQKMCYRMKWPYVYLLLHKLSLFRAECHDICVV